MYEGLQKYLKFLSGTYKLDICINDFSGFLQVDKQLLELLRPYMIHKNPFCMKVKAEEKLWQRCLKMKRGILLKCEKLKRPYYGMCYCGIEEYIVPIMFNDFVIGMICVGEFSTNRKAASYRINKLAREYSLDAGELEQKFEQSVNTSIPDAETVEQLFSILSEYLSSIYTSLAAVHKDLTLGNLRNNSSESYILNHAIEYIKQNYLRKIGIEEIARFCHCSSSYLSHIFKKNMKLNIKAYINRARVEHARSLLLDSDCSVTEVALSSGFSDPNYFSNVFRGFYDLSPLAYKKRYSKSL